MNIELRKRDEGAESRIVGILDISPVECESIQGTPVKIGDKMVCLIDQRKLKDGVLHRKPNVIILNKSELDKLEF